MLGVRRARGRAEGRSEAGPAVALRGKPSAFVGQVHVTGRRGQKRIDSLAILDALNDLATGQAEDGPDRSEDLCRGHLYAERGHQAEDGHNSRINAGRMSLNEVQQDHFP